MPKPNEDTFIIPEIIQKKWQGIIDIMARLIDVPAGLIMKIVEQDIEVFLSSQTDRNPYNPGDSEHLIGSGLYCETVIKTKNMLLVPDALSDKDWKDNPDVKLNMISYLGFPIIMPDGKAFGTICVLDRKENPYSATYIELVRSFREIVERDIELMWMNDKLGERNRKLSDFTDEIRTLREIIPVCSNCKKIKDGQGYWSQIDEYLKKYSNADVSHGLCEECARKLYGDQPWFKPQ